jgi:threonine aldolase
MRSDTVTRPSAAMRRAMADAEVGDDVYGEDPTVRLLEERVAERLSMEAGLFVTSGTLGNQLALGVHARAGDELLADAGSHCLVFEGGAASALWGIQPRVLPSRWGIFTADDLKASVRPENIHHARPRVVVVENTHNLGGGTVWPVDGFNAVVDAARALGLAVHLDGARLFNAEVASGVSAAKLASRTDSATVCFSKGLGAPVGSVLCGSKGLVHEARRLRKRLGGGMRQAGILAAGALYALEHNVARLAEDHQNARRLAEGLHPLPGFGVELARVQTNLVYVDVPGSSSDWVGRLAAEGVLVNATGPRTLRLACHLDVSKADVDSVLNTVGKLLGRRG